MNGRPPANPVEDHGVVGMCALSLTAKPSRVRDSDGRVRRRSTQLAELLIDKGIPARTRLPRGLRGRWARPSTRFPDATPNETFEQWVTRVGDSLDKGFDVIYQMPFVHDGMRGIADFLVRVDEPAEGYARYEPVDAKLTRNRGEARTRPAALFLRRRDRRA